MSQHRCSFCLKPSSDVKKLVAADIKEAGGAAICDECIDVCEKLVKEAPERSVDRAWEINR
jgi:ATP-dependent protease Clp ATPase subunit